MSHILDTLLQMYPCKQYKSLKNTQFYFLVLQQRILEGTGGVLILFLLVSTFLFPDNLGLEFGSTFTTSTCSSSSHVPLSDRFFSQFSVSLLCCSLPAHMCSSHSSSVLNPSSQNKQQTVKESSASGSVFQLIFI